MAELDTVLPDAAWKFDEAVTDVFDNMLERSIPQYSVMRDACLALARRFRRPHTDIVDLGCSRGAAMADLIREFGAHNRFIGVEVSQPMLAAVRERFHCYIDAGVVDIRDLDLRHGYPPARASVTLAILTIQFTPIEYRQRIMADIYRATVPGGALIMVEKVLGNSAEIDAAMVETYLDMKRANGYTEEQIERKRLALEGVLVPVTAAWNEELLRTAGWRHVDCFWRWQNFAGWVAVRDE